MNDSTGVFPQGVFNKRIKSDLPSFSVWVQCDNTYPDKRVAFSWISLPERPINGYDSIPYRNHGSAYDTCFYGTFRELNTSEFYIDPLAGFIGLIINVPENYNVGVTYETSEGKKYGEGKFDVNGNQSLILKMIKCANQSPDATPRAWELKMKNIYRLPYKDISQQNFKLGVKYNSNQNFLDTIPGMTMPLNQILLIDRYTGSTRRWNPDGKFDWLTNSTIYPETGDIIFPTLYPFCDELSKAGLDSNYTFCQIYSRRKIEAQIYPVSGKYFIIGYTDTLK
jgi:cell surface protein SprA